MIRRRRTPIMREIRTHKDFNKLHKRREILGTWGEKYLKEGDNADDLQLVVNLTANDGNNRNIESSRRGTLGTRVASKVDPGVDCTLRYPISIRAIWYSKGDLPCDAEEGWNINELAVSLCTTRCCVKKFLGTTNHTKIAFCYVHCASNNAQSFETLELAVSLCTTWCCVKNFLDQPHHIAFLLVNELPITLKALEPCPFLLWQFRQQWNDHTASSTATKRYKTGTNFPFTYNNSLSLSTLKKKYTWNSKTKLNH